MKKWIFVVVLLGIILFNGCFQNKISVTPQKIIEANILVTNGFGHGSGVYLGNGLILTARHCLDMQNLYVVDSKGNEYEIITKIYPEDITEDIGLIKIDPKAEIPAITVFGKRPKLLDKVYVCGNPLNTLLLNNLTVGVLTKEQYNEVKWDNAFIIDAVGGPGNSGGGVYNKNYELIGIFVGYYPPYIGFSICEPIDDILEILKACSIEVELEKLKVQ